MLNARARPPPDRDFVDIFQKFKLSFNLLVSLLVFIVSAQNGMFFFLFVLFLFLCLPYSVYGSDGHARLNVGCCTLITHL